MKHIEKFENFNSRVSLKDLNNDEHIIEFQIEEANLWKMPNKDF